MTTKPKTETATKSTLTEAVRQGVSEVQMLESSLFRGILEKERKAALDEVSLLQGQIDSLQFRVLDLNKIIDSADQALIVLNESNQKGVE